LLSYDTVSEEGRTVLKVDIPGGVFDMKNISEISLPQVPFDK
jgi:hypothetical protein